MEASFSYDRANTPAVQPGSMDNAPAELYEILPHRADEGFFEALHPAVAYSHAHGSVRVPGSALAVPYTISVPEILAEPRTVILIPGFGGFKRSSRRERNALAANHQRPALSYDPSRFGGLHNDLFRAQKLHTDTVSAIIEDLPCNQQLQNIQNGINIDMKSVILSVHSMGGLAGTAYTKQHPENVEAIIYKAAVGLENPKLLRFLSRLGPSLREEIMPALLHNDFGNGTDPIGTSKRVAQYYLSNLLRTSGEIVACFKGDVRADLDNFRKLGVKTGMLYFGKDKLIPAEASIRESGKRVDDYLLLPHLDHLAPQTHPQEVSHHQTTLLHKIGA